MSDIKREQMFGSVNELQRLEDDFGIAVMTENVPLPSKGRFYPPSHPFHNKETVAVRAMTAKDENILLNQSYVKDGTVIEKLIESCCVDHVDASTLTLGDRNALMVYIRLVGYGQDYETEVKCPNCGTVSETRFDLSLLQINEAGEGCVDESTATYEFILPKIQRRVRFKLSFVQDEKNLMEMQKRADKIKKTRGINVAENNVATNSLKYQIVGIEGKDGIFVEDRAKLAKFIDYIPAQDASALRQYMKDVQPGIDMGQYFECPSCQYEGRVEMPLGASFFWPDARNKT
jgi:hypothetical protein